MPSLNALADNSSMNLMPGANSGGSNVAVPGGDSSGSPSLGSTDVNPLLPQFPSGTSTPSISSTINLVPGGGSGAVPTGTANLSTMGSDNPAQALVNLFGLLSGSSATGTTPTANGGSTSPAFSLLNQNPALNPSDSKIITAFKNAGFESGIAALLDNFLKSGAGFNPAVAQMLVDSMGPNIKRHEADIMEWFGSRGMGNSGSSAALAMGDYLSQVELNQEQIFAGLYEQSVQNYLNVLLAGKREMKPGGGGSGFDAAMTVFQTLAQVNASRH